MKLFLSILLCFPMMSLAQFEVVDDSRVVEENPGDNQGGLTSGTIPETSSTIDDTGENLGETGGFNATQQGGLDGTGSAGSSGNMVLGLGLAMGSSFLGPCQTPTGQWACPLAAMAFADALSGNDAQRAAYQTGTYFDPTLGTGGSTEAPFDEIQVAQAQEGLQALSEMGYTVNGDGSVTTPDGQTVTAADMASAEAMQGIGMSPEQAANAMNQIAGAKASAAKKMGIDLEKMEAESSTGGGGGAFGGLAKGAGGGGAAGVGGDSIIEEIEYRNKKGKDKRLPASEAAKLSKLFNGEPIGIGMADLFLIVHEKYKEKKRKKTNFIRKEY